MVRAMRITWFHGESGEHSGDGGSGGGSVFDELDITLGRERRDAQGHLLRSSNVFTSSLVQFTELPAGLDQTWHPAPRRQLVTILSGMLEVTVSDGSARRFGAGEVFLADDAGTSGHRTRVVDGPVLVQFAPMGDEVDLTAWAAG